MATVAPVWDKWVARPRQGRTEGRGLCLEGQAFSCSWGCSCPISRLRPVLDGPGPVGPRLLCSVPLPQVTRSFVLSFIHRTLTEGHEAPGTGLGAGEKGRQGMKPVLGGFTPQPSIVGLGRSMKPLGEGDRGPVTVENASLEERHK